MIETTFVYECDGEPMIGTIADYAKTQEHAYYAGFGVSNSVFTFTADGSLRRHQVTAESIPFDEDDYGLLTFSVTLDGEVQTASVRIDGRA